MITIVLADDHTIVRQGLRMLLEAEPDFSVLGEAGDGLEALQLVEKLQPNILIVDVMMPKINGLEVARQISQRTHQTRVIVLSMHANEAYVLEALRSGAVGYVLKDSSANEVVQAVRKVVQGRRYLSAPMSERAIEVYIQKSQQSSLDNYDTLTTREREVLHLAAEGRSNPEIAKLLSISSRTVETHRTKLMRKLNLQNQTDLIRFALKHGILPLDD